MFKLKKIAKKVLVNLIILNTLLLNSANFNMPINFTSEVKATGSGSFSSVDDLRNGLISWAEAFNNQYGYYSDKQKEQGYNTLICHYPESDVYSARQASFDCGGKLDSNGQYVFDCVGWVQFAIYYGLGIPSNYTAYQGMYATPQHGIKDTQYLEYEDASQIQPGDIIIFSGHIAIFIGNGQKLDMSHDYQHGLHITSANLASAVHIAKFTDAAVSAATGSTEIPDVKPATPTNPTNPSNPGSGQYPNSNVLDDNVNLDDLDFKLAGNPKTITYKGHTNLLKNIFSLFSKFMAYL